MMKLSLQFTQRIPAVKRNNHKVLVSIFIVLLLLVGILGAVYLSQQEQDPRQRAAELQAPPGTVAIVYDEFITEQMLRAEAEKQYAKSAITPEVLSIMLEMLIEQKLLERQTNGQTNISDSVMQQQTQTLFPGAEEITTSMLAQAKFTLLKNEVSKTLSDTREAYTIGFWLPPEDYDVPLTTSQLQTITAQRRLVTQVVSEARERLEANEEPLAIAQDMLRSYPILQPILAVNGYLLDTTENEGLLTTPVLYTLTEENAKNPLFTTLFAMQPGQVREITAPSSTGALIVKVVSATDGQFENYKSWLETQKQRNVRIVDPL